MKSKQLLTRAGFGLTTGLVFALLLAAMSTVDQWVNWQSAPTIFVGDTLKYAILLVPFAVLWTISLIKTDGDEEDDKAYSSQFDGNQLLSRGAFWFAFAITVLILVFAISVFFSKPFEDRTLEAMGAYIGGSAAVISIWWVVAGLLVQTRELQLQRAELFVQRRAIEQNAATMQLGAVFRLSELAVSELGANARQLAMTLFADDTLDAIDRSYNRGDHEAHIKFLLDQKNLNALLVEKIVNQRDLLSLSLMRKYCDYNEQFLAVINGSQFNTELFERVYRDRETSKLARVFKDALSRSEETEND